jgi:hypothetical protein
LSPLLQHLFEPHIHDGDFSHVTPHDPWGLLNDDPLPAEDVLQAVEMLARAFDWIMDHATLAEKKEVMR